MQDKSFFCVFVRKMQKSHLFILKHERKKQKFIVKNIFINC